jgi:hypothetical protein
MELASAKARPFESIDLGLEFDGEAPEFVTAQVTEASLDSPYYTRVGGSAEDGWTLTAPIHPTGTGGGAVDIRVVGDGFECPDTAELELEPLDAHEGATRDAVDLSSTLLTRHAELFGVDPANLATALPDEIPTPLWGSAVGWTLLEDEEYAYSLRNVLEGNTEEARQMREGLAIADALLAEAGYVDLLRRGNEQVDAIGSADFEHEFGPASDAMPGALVPRAGTTTRTRRAALCPAPLSVRFGDNPKALNFYMRTAEYARQMLASEGYENVQTAVTAASLVPYPPLNAAAAIISILVETKAQSWEAMANTLPSQLGDPKVDITVERFEEDARYAGEWENYRVRASSRGWNPTSLMLGNLWTAFEAVVGAHGRIAGKAREAAESGSLVGDFIENAGGEAVGEARGEFFDKFGEEWEACEIAPESWGPVDLSDSAYSEHSYLGSIGQVRGDRFSYGPAEVGEGRVSVHADPELFPPASNELASNAVADVTVEKILITLDPSPGALEPAESLKIKALVRHAVDKSVEWETSAGSITQTLQIDDDGNPIAEFTAPSTQDEFPVAVRARSTATRGLRGDGASLSDPRFGWGYYRKDEGVVVTPGFGCLEPGESMEFTATVQGHDDEVSWSVTGGSIEKLDPSRARYTAPDDGIHEITATADADSSLSSLARVSVGPCKCFAQASWSGAISGAIGSYNNIHFIPAEGVDNFTITFQDEVGPGSVGIQVQQAAPTAGRQDAVILVTPNGEFGPGTAGFQDEDSAALNVITLEDHWLEATFTANFELFGTVFTDYPMPVTLTGTVQLYHFQDTLQANIEGRTCQTTEPVVGGM